MDKPNPLLLSEEETKTLASNWQKVIIPQMNNLFVAYDEKAGEAERVLAFYLDEEALNEIAEIKTIETIEPLEIIEHYFIIHLGVTSNYFKESLNSVPTPPFFKPFLEVSTKTTTKTETISEKSHYYAMNWSVDPPFATDADNKVKDGVLSSTDAIPGAGAYLFVRSWLEMPFEQLHKPFTGIANGLDRRVKSYIFQPIETQSIIEDIKKNGNGGRKRLYMYMGNGISVQSHPFSFRPVLEVEKVEEKVTIDAVTKNVTTKLTRSSSFYDFSRPNPPYGPK